VPPFRPSLSRDSVCIRVPLDLNMQVSLSAAPSFRLPSAHYPLTNFLALYFHHLTNPSSHLLDLVPLYFHDLTNPFSRNPFHFTSIQNPRGVGVLRYSTFKVPTCNRANSFAAIDLPPLVLSWLSFPHSLPLFSTACSLFCQKQGGGCAYARNSASTRRSLRLCVSALSFLRPLLPLTSVRRGFALHLRQFST
jgi:hypothetical protein